MFPVDSGKSGRVRFALAQFRATTDPRQNLEFVADAARQAADDGAQVVVFPEATMCSFLRPISEVAQPLDGLWATEVRGLAAQLGITIVVGMFTKTGDHRVRNTLLVTGDAEAHYDKIHLFDALGQKESDSIAPGEKLVTVDVSGQRLGLGICYDIRFPTQFLNLAGLGAKIMLVCASWAPGPTKLQQWQTLATARAMDTTSFVVAVDQASSPQNVSGAPTGIGHSMVVDPSGRVLLELGDDPELALIDIDLEQVDAVRAALPLLG